jgi:hypothetical protein
MPSWISVNARHVPTLHCLNCGHQLAYCSSPRWYMSMEKHGGIILTGEAKELREKPAPVPLFPPQIAHSVTRAWTRASTVKSLTAWAMARPKVQTCTLGCRLLISAALPVILVENLRGFLQFFQVHSTTAWPHSIRVHFHVSFDVVQPNLCNWRGVVT